MGAAGRSPESESRAALFDLLDKKPGLGCGQVFQPPYRRGDSVLARRISGATPKEYCKAVVIDNKSIGKLYNLVFEDGTKQDAVPLNHIRPLKRSSAVRQFQADMSRERSVNQFTANALVGAKWKSAATGQSASKHFKAIVLGRNFDGTYCLNYGHGQWGNAPKDIIRRPHDTDIVWKGSPESGTGDGNTSIHSSNHQIGDEVSARWKPQDQCMYSSFYDARVVGKNEDSTYCLNYGHGWWWGHVPNKDIQRKSRKGGPESQKPLLAWNALTRDPPGSPFEFR